VLLAGVELKPLPVIVMTDPTAPDRGVMELMAGWANNKKGKNTDASRKTKSLPLPVGGVMPGFRFGMGY
jgi:hypothetical protein